MVQKAYRIVYIISFALFPWLVLSPAVNLPANIPLRLAIFCVICAAGAFIFHQAWQSQGWANSLLLTTLGYATAYKLASFIPDVSTYPFSLGWSEASRYYYASLWLSQQVYGQLIPPSVLHPSRYLLQSIPFLIPNVSLWLNRFWQVILWVITAGLTSWLLIHRLAVNRTNKSLAVILGLASWSFLFLFQGPIYYHLLFMVILILWGTRSTHFWRTLIIVVIASLWAGISRVNWLPVPGLLAAALYLLEVKVKGKSMWSYLLPAVVWVVAGTGIAYASQQAYQLWSGNPPAWFNSSFTSDLLWYRLLPNVTFPLGILPSALLVSLPLVGLMILRLIGHWREYHFIRMLGLVAILGVLFLGGVIVSVKIGGGSNLHNLDAYLTLLLVIGSFVYFDRFLPDSSSGEISNQNQQPKASSDPFRITKNIFIVGALVFPVYFTISAGGQLPKRDFSTAQAAIQAINSATQQVANQGGEVLFISQRQLLTFDYVKNVPLVPNYELVFLMEMAMANNTAYMDAFHSDISNQRFAMIVSEPLVVQYQGRHHSFGEENDAWVERVSVPVLCYYEPAVSLEDVGLILYTPRANPCK